MKNGLVAIIAINAVLVGSVVGMVTTYREFANEKGVAAAKTNLNSASGHIPRVTSGMPQVGEPKLHVIDTSDFDFGVMEKNETRSHTFVIKNVGDAPLTLSKVDVTCKCTTSSKDEMRVAPGGSTEVDLNWTPPSFQREFRQSATFKTNDSSQPMLRLEIHGRVIQSLRASPDSIAVNNISANQPHAAEVYVFCYREGEVDLEFDHFENPTSQEHFKVDVERLPEDIVAREQDAVSGYKVTLTIEPGLPLGPIREKLHFRTNLGVPPVEIPVHGAIAGDITLLAGGGLYDSERRVINIGGVRGATGGEYQLHVLVKGPYVERTEITGATAEPDNVLKVSIDTQNRKPLSKGYIVPMKITIPPGSPSVSRLGTSIAEDDRNYGKIIISTTHPVTKEVLVYVKFAVDR